MRILASLILIVAGQHVFAGVSLSHGIGEVTSALKMKHLQRSIGTPDSIRTEKWYGYPKKSLIYVYSALNVEFTFSNEKPDKKKLKYIDIFQKSPLSIDGVSLATIDSTQLQKNYGTPVERKLYKEYIAYRYVVKLMKEELDFALFFHQTGKFYSCHFVITQAEE